MKRKPLPRLKTKEQEAKAMKQRADNRRAARDGKPLPFPNPWDEWDPTKVEPGSSVEEIHQSYVEFNKICPAPPRRVHIL
jgi:hypothetical protein